MTDFDKIPFDPDDLCSDGSAFPSSDELKEAIGRMGSARERIVVDSMLSDDAFFLVSPPNYRELMKLTAPEPIRPDVAGSVTVFRTMIDPFPSLSIRSPVIYGTCYDDFRPEPVVHPKVNPLPLVVAAAAVLAFFFTVWR